MCPTLSSTPLALRFRLLQRSQRLLLNPTSRSPTLPTLHEGAILRLLPPLFSARTLPALQPVWNVREVGGVDPVLRPKPKPSTPQLGSRTNNATRATCGAPTNNYHWNGHGYGYGHGHGYGCCYGYRYFYGYGYGLVTVTVTVTVMALALLCQTPLHSAAWNATCTLFLEVRID